jgi:hypothetical protein
MYSSLDRIDIVASDDPDKPLFVQTDHRTADEIEDERELSTIFALTKVMAPLRMNENATVCYAPMHELPEFFEDVLGAAGAEIHAMATDERREAARSGTDSPAELADAAFAALAARVRERESLSDGEAGLVELEDRIAGRGLDPEIEEDEIEYWTAVVELAAVTGELLRSEHGGAWVEDEPNAATIPFLFRFGANWLNPTGKAQKFLAHGDRDRPSHLLTMARDGHGDTGSAEEGPILLAFKPADWAEQVVYSALLERQVPGTPPPPIIAYGRDYPNTFAYYHRDNESGEDVDALRAEALANLAAIEVETDTLQVGDDLELVSVHGSFFAAEKVLDPVFMRGLHERLGAELLAAGIPKKGLLLVTSAVQAPEVIAGFVRICEHEFESDPGGALYPLPLLVSGGEVVGVAVPEGAVEPDADGEAPPPSNGARKKKGFLSRLFGKS